MPCVTGMIGATTAVYHYKIHRERKIGHSNYRLSGGCPGQTEKQYRALNKLMLTLGEGVHFQSPFLKRWGFFFYRIFLLLKA